MNEEEIQKLFKQHQGKDVVAWRFWSGDWQYVCDKRMLRHLTDDVFVEPLFLAPNKWQELTDEEIQVIHETYYRRMGPNEFARLVEAKIKEKNI